MQFTDKEIELAKQLEKVGLEWKPEIGDCFIHRDEIYILRDVGNEVAYGIRHYPYEEECVFPLCYCIWLPLWHQCRGILAEKNLDISLVDSKYCVMLTLWKRKWWNGTDQRSLEFMTQIKADTDLEAMYKAILEVLRTR